MPEEELPLLDALRGLALLQQKFLNLALFVASQGPATFEGELLTCSLPDDQRRISTLLAMAAGQSVETLLSMAKLRGIPVRDAYPIARSALESFVNASYLLSESDEVASRAIRYVNFAAWRLHNKKIGSGEFSFELRSDPDPSIALATEWPEFSGKGQGNWTALDVPSRIRRVGELAGRRAGSRLLGGYALIYSISSEIIHGSPFGASYFYSGHSNGEKTADALVVGSVLHLEEIFVAVLHAGCGYLSAFFGLQDMEAPLKAEEKIFERLLDLSTKPRSEFPTMPVETEQENREPQDDA
ncbi:DUF5677 domain-containing protein [Methylomonas sp. DH-1]|uniref:DUF5677 domain-containing protein n=1 Tax=Methylomonas sp. (strain DH-1) TaxID=1727196 RepID=UPI0007C937FC|nr:DUF5677 domain-containing protein [Methylomonas sp. DH-1]ANE54696.1 hypothetical protein AYM39_05520 [Methylomonas sp. DH-1]